MPKSTSLASVISPGELAAILDEPGLVLIDCRFDLMDPAAGRGAWQMQRIPGAAYADLDKDLAGPVTSTTGRHPLPDARAQAKRFREMGVSAGSQVVVYDDSAGAIAARAWWLLRWLGHAQVAVLDGGFSAWAAEGHTIDTGSPRDAHSGDFEGTPNSEWVVTTEMVLEEGADAVRLIDARDAARFRGEHEPIDPVAGHVPGAGNLPFSELVTADGRFFAPEALRERLEAALDGDLASPWSVMCGSGVTACHLAVAAHHAGIRPPRLYVGSFSEWIRAPERPVATGEP